MKKIDRLIVWHEFGHIFGYILVNRLYSDYRKISEIKLCYSTLNPQIVPSTSDKNPLHEREIELIKSIIIYTFGAIFHVTLFNDNKQTSLSDFNKIFTNTEYKPVITDLYGHASKDFHFIKNFIRQEKSKINMTSIKEFTFELQCIMMDEKIFDLLKPYIAEFEKKYNGKHTKNNDLYNEKRKEIYEMIPIKFINRVTNLIDKHFC